MKCKIYTYKWVLVGRSEGSTILHITLYVSSLNLSFGLGLMENPSFFDHFWLWHKKSPPKFKIEQQCMAPLDLPSSWASESIATFWFLSNYWYVIMHWKWGYEMIIFRSLFRDPPKTYLNPIENRLAQWVSIKNLIGGNKKENVPFVLEWEIREAISI